MAYGMEPKQGSRSARCPHCRKMVGEDEVIGVPGSFQCPHCSGWLTRVTHSMWSKHPGKMEWTDGNLLVNKNPAAVELGRRGGKATSERKKRSSAENGKKGGRPKKSASHVPSDGIQPVP